MERMLVIYAINGPEKLSNSCSDFLGQIIKTLVNELNEVKLFWLMIGLLTLVLIVIIFSVKVYCFPAFHCNKLESGTQLVH